MYFPFVKMSNSRAILQNLVDLENAYESTYKQYFKQRPILTCPSDTDGFTNKIGRNPTELAR